MPEELDIGMLPSALVTGGAGFIGSELVSQLVAAGWRVTVIDNLATGRWENLDGLDGVERLTQDIRDLPELPDCSVVFHLACLGVRHSIRAPRETHEVNATGTLAVLEAARSAGVQRFVYVSSSDVYGSAQCVPMTEQHPTFPSTAYGASKLAGEAYARAYNLSYGLPTVVVRPFNTYGPRCHHEGDSGEVIPKFLLRAQAGCPLVIFGDGEQTRDFTYVSDTAQGILQAGICADAVGRTFNLGSGREVSINTLARLAKGVRIVHEPSRPGDITRLVADATLARELLGFESRVKLEDGLERLRAWYRSRGVPAEKLLQEEVVHNWR
ncbi:MAG TPA: NAD-dependent epimerase/dehydratase family protein [Bryobacteraceae bacterium]|nr:NAD-dependent epimerase/dehydratase family protein [Bryobacteraceae bacterium]